MPVGSVSASENEGRPPPRPRASWFKPFGRADFIGFAIFACVLAVLDFTFMAVGRHSDDTRVFVLWFCLQALACVGAGVFQLLRRRNWQEVAIVGVIAATLLAFIILVMVNPDTGSPDCASQAPCDTSFGLGAVVIAAVAFPVFSAMAAAGRTAGRLGLHANRTDRRSQ